MAGTAQVGCSWCLDINYFLAQNHNLDLAKASQVPCWRESEVFPPQIMSSAAFTPVGDHFYGAAVEISGPLAVRQIPARIIERQVHYMRLNVTGRRAFLTSAVPLAVVGAAGVGGGFATEKAVSALGPTARTARLAGPGAYEAIVTFRTAPAANLIALTIDDGPTPEWTPQLLEILERRRATATFFRVGERAQATPELVKRTAGAGHEQANHTWAHDDLTQNSEAFDRETLERTHELITKLTGRPPTLCRPPWGRIDSVGLAVCAELHYDVTLWSQHVTGANAQGDVDMVLKQASPGSIVLAHDGGSEPNSTLMRQLDRLLASMTDAGYRFVTVSELLAIQRQAH